MEKKGANEVVVTISSEEEDSESGSFSKIQNLPQVEIPNNHQFNGPNFELLELETLNVNVQTPTSSSQTANASPTPWNKPPKIPTDSAVRRRSLTRAAYSKPKSRLVEPSSYSTKLEKTVQSVTPKSPYLNSPNLGSSPTNKITETTPKEKVRSWPVTPKTPLMAAVEEEEEDDDEVYTSENVKASGESGLKSKIGENQAKEVFLEKGRTSGGRAARADKGRTSGHHAERAELHRTSDYHVERAEPHRTSSHRCRTSGPYTDFEISPTHVRSFTARAATHAARAALTQSCFNMLV